MSKSPAPLPKNVSCYKILTHPEGADLIADLDLTFGLNADTFVPNSQGIYDPIQAALRDGSRRVLLHIHKRIAAVTNEAPTPKESIKA